MKTSSQIELRMLHTSDGLVIDYRRAKLFALATRYRYYAVRLFIAGVVVSVIGSLIFKSGSVQGISTAINRSSAVFALGALMMTLGGLPVLLTLCFPSMRQGKDYNPSGVSRLVFGDEWIIIRDFRIRDRVKRRILREKIGGFGIIEGIGGTEFGVLALCLVDEDPLHLMLRAPLTTLGPVVQKIAEEFGEAEDYDEEEGWGEDPEQDYFGGDEPDDDSGGSGGDGTMPLFGQDAA